MLLVVVVILTTYPQEDRVAVVIKTQDRHALGEAQIRKVCDPGLASAIRVYTRLGHNFRGLIGYFSQ